jgi:murein DD-endopeptidase MepM/ murein hydrolase activator NlpD
LIPIIASASGKVEYVHSTYPPDQFNGFYMVIRHYINGVDTGYSTLYLHMTAPPARSTGVLWNVGDTINQGDQIGFMGATGNTGGGVHLHFAVRYNDASPFVAGTTSAGAKNIQQLTNATMEGLLFKSYQTDCPAGGGLSIRQYSSSNRQYQ